MTPRSAALRQRALGSPSLCRYFLQIVKQADGGQTDHLVGDSHSLTNGITQQRGGRRSRKASKAWKKVHSAPATNSLAGLDDPTEDYGDLQILSGRGVNLRPLVNGGDVKHERARRVPDWCTLGHL